MVSNELQIKTNGVLVQYMNHEYSDGVFMKTWIKIGMSAVMLQHAHGNFLRFVRRYRSRRFNDYASTGANVVLHYINS